MLIGFFDNYAAARDTAISYSKGGKKHPGLRGVEYRVYCYYGKYALWRGREINDFPRSVNSPVFSVRV